MKISKSDLAIRAIEAYLTWTPRDRRREIASQILHALIELGWGPREEIFEEIESHMDEVHAYAKHSPFNVPIKAISIEQWQALKKGD